MGVAVALSAWLMWEHNLATSSAASRSRCLDAASLSATCGIPASSSQCLGSAQDSRGGTSATSSSFSRSGAFAAALAPLSRRALGFCAAQWIDDLLDGDRPSDREPLEIVDELFVSSNLFLDSVAALFAEARCRWTARFPRPRADNARGPRARARARHVDGGQLNAHHRTTFTLR